MSLASADVDGFIQSKASLVMGSISAQYGDGVTAGYTDGAAGHIEVFAHAANEVKPGHWSSRTESTRLISRSSDQK